MTDIEAILIAIKEDDNDAFDPLVDKIEELIAMYKAEQEKLVYLSNKVTDLNRENAIVKASKGTPDEKINNMQKRIKELTEDLNNHNSMDLKLPIITESFQYSENKLIVIKELKNAIYMNSLLEYIGICNSIRAEFENKKTLVIVVDDLRQELRVQKYHKHNFAINKVPDSSGIFITNKSFEEIQDILNFSMYDIVLVIDRSMQTRCAVNHSKEDIYYLVDSETDMVDFNVNSKKCIGFFTTDNITGFNITPGIDNLNNPEQRPGLIASCEFVVRVLGYED